MTAVEPSAASDPELPDDLEIGVATSAWQIEGSAATRGRCIWDDFAERPGAIVDGSAADPACDHVHRLTGDLDLLAWLGVDAYRFSISWPRVMPGGTGAVSPSGLDFYERLVDGLLARGIAPVATLYHWDLPSSLQDGGGWPARDTAAHFADYAGAVAERLADRVHRWATLNEPWCAAFLGHASGVHAPGQQDGAAALRAAHHLMLGHGWAVQQMRARGAGRLGIALNLIPAEADTGSAERGAEYVDALQNQLFLQMLAGGDLPSSLVEGTRHLTDWSFVEPGDLAVTAAPIDWLGENYYTITRVGEGSKPGDPDVVAFPGAPPMHFAPRPPRTEMGWEIAPSGLIIALQLAHRALPDLPLFVTENGAAVHDLDEGSAVHDPDRITYLRAHLEAVLRARASGLPVHGYFVWSLLDNIEWAHGWTKRFGLVRVDPRRLERRPKDSAWWLRGLLAARGRRPPTAVV